MKSLQEQLEEIMQYFDFEHVLQMMHWGMARVDYDDYGNHIDYHKWKMLLEDGRFDVPSLKDLRNDAEKLLKEVIDFAKKNPKSKFHTTGTGPFRATYRYGIIELDCIFENWSCD